MFKFELRKLSYLVLGSLISFTGAVAFAGGGFVNNGGGIAEKNVLYAYEKLDTYIQLCLSTNACKLSREQGSLLLQIYRALPLERHSKQLFFSSEKKTPGFFMIDGNVRVAKTGDAIGSPIYINSDLLYTKGYGDSYDPVTIPEAVAILIHEMGHHQGFHSHEELDLLGVRVSLLLQQKFIYTPLIPWSPNEISASVLNANMTDGFPQVLLNVGDEILDVSNIYAHEVHCEVFTLPIPILPIPDLELITKTPRGSLFHNLHWEKIKDKPDYLTVQITGNVSNNCQYKNDVGIRNNNFQMTISFRINKVGNKWVTDKNSITMNQFKDPWWKLIRLPGQ
jgi:hypothetical protein